MSGHNLSPEHIGIGMRISIQPHAEDYERIIVGALEETKNVLAAHNAAPGLEISTGAVSTYVGVKTGDAAQQLAAYAATLIYTAAIESNGMRLTSQILLSRGNPTVTTGTLVPGEIPADKPVFLERSGLVVTASWSLYPMADDGKVPHIEFIMAALQEAKDAGLTVTDDHYVAEVRGDLSSVLTVLVDAWNNLGQHVPHVVSHMSLSVDAPNA